MSEYELSQYYERRAALVTDTDMETIIARWDAYLARTSDEAADLDWRT